MNIIIKIVFFFKTGLFNLKKYIAKKGYQKDLKSFGENSNIASPLEMLGKKNISIGNNVQIAYKCRLAAVPHTKSPICELIIKDGCLIGNFNHIYATKRILIEENVLTADRVYISDNLHGYSAINTPILAQPIVQKKEVVIGSGSWLGENVCVIGASIGKNCVVGANSVVINDIPDFCVVVGAPAKVVKRYNCITGSWEKC